MRALICKEYGPVEALVIEERPEPVPGPGEALIGIRAAGINFVDVLSIAGNYQIKTPTPFIPGSEAAGIVQAVGEGVERLKPGDRVMITPPVGAFAEKCALPEMRCLPLPERLGFEQGAGFCITYATAYHALRQGAVLKAGETLLVLGAAGGSGIAAVEIAKAFGAIVIAAASSDDKLEFAQEAGADHTINYSVTSLREALKDVTGGEGVNVVFDPVGGELAQVALRSLAWQGRYLVIGFACGDIPEFPANIALLKEARIVGVWWGAWTQRHTQESMQNMQELGAMVAAGKLNPRITESYPLEQYHEAFAAITERRARGKVILTMD